MQGYASLMRGAGSGKVVEAGRSSQSVLFQAITNPDAEALARKWPILLASASD